MVDIPLDHLCEGLWRYVEWCIVKDYVSTTTPFS